MSSTPVKIGAKVTRSRTTNNLAIEDGAAAQLAAKAKEEANGKFLKDAGLYVLSAPVVVGRQAIKSFHVPEIDIARSPSLMAYANKSRSEQKRTRHLDFPTMNSTVLQVVISYLRLKEVCFDELDENYDFASNSTAPHRDLKILDDAKEFFGRRHIFDSRVPVDQVFLAADKWCLFGLKRAAEEAAMIRLKQGVANADLDGAEVMANWQQANDHRATRLMSVVDTTAETLPFDEICRLYREAAKEKLSAQAANADDSSVENFANRIMDNIVKRLGVKGYPNIAVHHEGFWTIDVLMDYVEVHVGDVLYGIPWLFAGEIHNDLCDFPTLETLMERCVSAVRSGNQSAKRCVSFIMAFCDTNVYSRLSLMRAAELIPGSIRRQHAHDSSRTVRIRIQYYRLRAEEDYASYSPRLSWDWEDEHHESEIVLTQPLSGKVRTSMTKWLRQTNIFLQGFDIYANLPEDDEEDDNMLVNFSTHLAIAVQRSDDWILLPGYKTRARDNTLGHPINTFTGFDLATIAGYDVLDSRKPDAKADDDVWDVNVRVMAYGQLRDAFSSTRAMSWLKAVVLPRAPGEIYTIVTDYRVSSGLY